jgi:hypothetical protein
MFHVRWTARGLADGWEWIPEEAEIWIGRLTGSEDAQSLWPFESMHSVWTSPEKRASHQAFADATALFAQEANLLPHDMCIYWIGDHDAVSWDRPNGVLRHHRVTAGDWPTVHAPDAEIGSTRDLHDADMYAREALGAAA